MLKKETVSKIKNTMTLIIVGAVISLIPFYFQTRAMTDENSEINEKQEQRLIEHEQQIQESMVNDAIEKTESQQIKEALKRIEDKLDRLIEKEAGSIN